MKQITFRQLQTNTEWIKDLPVEIVRYGKVVAVVERPMKVSGFPKAKNSQLVPETIEVHESKSFLVGPQPLKVAKAVEKAWDALPNLCPCGVPKTVCKKHMFSKG